MLESLCGKAKGQSGDNWGRLRQQDQCQSLDGLLVSKPFQRLKSTDRQPDIGQRSESLASGSASQRRSQWLSTNCSNCPNTASTRLHSLSQCTPQDPLTSPHSTTRPTIPLSRSFVDYRPPNSLNMDNRPSPTFLINSSPDHQSSQLRGGSAMTRQNAITSESASIISHSRPLKLSAIQKLALQNTWRIMKDNSAERIAEKIFQKLVNQQPKVKDVFYKAAFLTIFSRSNQITTCRDHARLLVRVITDLVTNLDRSETVMSQIRECGMKHVFLRQSGFKADIWEKFGEAAIEVINEQDCVKSNIESVKAWTILVASVTDEMRHGFEKEVRRRSYTQDRPKSACE